MFFLAGSCLDEIFGSQNSVPIFAMGGGFLVAIIGIVFTTIKSMVVSKAREETRREMAAYVAEGSIDADKAIAMLKAGGGKSDIEKL